MSRQLIILKIAVPIPKHCFFDYLPPADFDSSKQNIPALGTRVQVSFHNRQLVGLLVEVANKSSIDHKKLKCVHQFLDETPALTPEILKCALRAARYYHYPEGEALHSALPTRLRILPKNKKGDTQSSSKKQKGQIVSAPMEDKPITKLILSAEQEHVVREVLNKQQKWRPFLLDGVSGSGKTEVYKRVALEITRQNKQVLILVPEIGLTPQIAVQFADYFGDNLRVIHSKMTALQRYQAWQDAKEGRVKIVIGTRTAVFTPMSNLGLIIVDEEHDISFKQQSGFRYSARDVAILRAQMQSTPMILGSATPSLESIHNARQQRYHHLLLSARPQKRRVPKYHVIDTSNQTLQGGIALPLMRAIANHIDNGDQVLIFLNKRGYGRIWICVHCAWIQECPNCHARLVFHLNPAHLRCHRCNYSQKASEECPQCLRNGMQASGVGTQKCEHVLKENLPDTPIYRIDSDNIRSVSKLESIITRVKSGQSCILIGTQMLSKGHDLPNLTLAAILDCDGYLYDTDFRAAERFGQLVTQIAGRAGRQDKTGEVIIQTRDPDNPLLHKLINHQYADFAQKLLDERRQRSLPPYRYMALLNCEARSSVAADKLSTQLRNTLDTVTLAGLTLVGPIPPVMNTMRTKWHLRTIIVYANSRNARNKFLTRACQIMEQAQLDGASHARCFVDVDPQSV